MFGMPQLLQNLSEPVPPDPTPSTPTLALARVSTTAFTATITGADAGNIIGLFYRTTAETSWSLAGRTGNGDIDVSGITAGATVLAVAQASDGTLYSATSQLAAVTLTAPGTAATGIVSLPLYNLQTLLCSTAAFQAWVDAASTEEARERLHLVAVEEADFVRPCGLIFQGEPGLWTATKSAGGSRNVFAHSGELMLRLWDTIDRSVSAAETEMGFMNTVGLVLAQAEVLAGSGGFLHVTEWLKTDGPWVDDPDKPGADRDRVIGVEFQVTWGGF